MIDSKQSDPKLKAELPPQRTESRQAQTLPGSNTQPVVAATGTAPTENEIAALAYQFWIERGSPHGSHEEDWHRAEQDLRGKQSQSTRTASA